MRFLDGFRLRTEYRAAILAAIIIVQSLCALFFLADVAGDWDGFVAAANRPHLILETVAAITLAAAAAFLMVELSNLLARMEAMDSSLRASRGEMAVVIDNFFERWSLTPSERDVALLVLKGFDNEAIATLRGTARGTVRAQCTKIYAKAGVDGRAQLLSIFMEELLDGGVSPGPAPAPSGLDPQPAQ